MIRGTSLALAALAGAFVLSGVAQAASPLTLKCVRNEATKLRNCISECRNTFKTARAACYGPGLACANKCTFDPDPTIGNDACLAPVTASLRACNDACASAQRDAIDVCRSQFQNGLINESQLDACVNAARAVNLDCRLTCTDNHDEARLACAQQLGACLAACASCGTPTQCPAQ